MMSAKKGFFATVPINIDIKDYLQVMWFIFSRTAFILQSRFSLKFVVRGYFDSV